MLRSSLTAFYLESNLKKLNKHIEFETKYKVDGSKIYQFKDIVSKMAESFTFLYVEGPDFYFTESDGSFLRYRKSPMDPDGRAELTLKKKPLGAHNNIIRIEVNLRVDKNPYDTVHAFVDALGFKFNFKIYKMCHIYYFADANLVFYTVTADDKEVQHFIEIEINEEKTHTLTEDQAWAIIKKYEAILEPLGITYRNRLNKSLYEMYVKDIYKTENVLPLVGVIDV